MKWSLVLAFVSIACSGKPAAEPLPPNRPQPVVEPPTLLREARRVVIFQGGKESGGGVTRFYSDGTIEFEYAHLDNGRGPVVKGRAGVLANGTLGMFRATGTHTFGNEIDERFALVGGVATWNSKEEQGKVELSKAAFYLPMAAWPESTALLFAALRKAGGTLAILPGGEARLEQVAAASVTSSQGEEKKLLGWAITGLELEPVRLWTDDQEQFFGTVSDWYSYLDAGWEPAIPVLLELQKVLDAQRGADHAERLAHAAPAAGLALVHARVFDSVKKRWLADHTVVIKGGKIAAVGPSKSTKPPKGAEVIDAEGKALVPGLWDMHGHLGQVDGLLDLAAGVTTVRDLGNDPDFLDDFKARIERGEALGPTIIRSGFIEGRGPNAASSRVTAETEAEAREAVEFFAKRGYKAIKIYNSMKAELVPVLAKLAHEKGMRVSGHVPVFMRAEDVVRAGYDEIQHINMLFLNFLVDEKTDTRTKLRFTLVGDRAAEVDLDGQPMKDFIALLLEKKIVIDPTLNAFEDLFVGRPGEVLPGWAASAERLPAQVQRWFKTGGLPASGEKIERYRDAYARMLDLVRRLHEAGVPIVAGTDSLAGFAMHRELELYVQAGISPADALIIATLGAARVLGRDKASGSIAKGKAADLVLIDGDPLANISDLRKSVLTVKGGVIYRAADLYQAAAVRP
jgi:hypothetical protein